MALYFIREGAYVCVSTRVCTVDEHKTNLHK